MVLCVKVLKLLVLAFCMVLGHKKYQIQYQKQQVNIMVSIEQRKILNPTLPSLTNLIAGLNLVKNLLKLMAILIASLVVSVGLSMCSPQIKELLPMKYEAGLIRKSNRSRRM